MIDNYFSPSFGNKPRVLVGRESELNELKKSLLSDAGSKERARLIIGQRGLGKTVLMLELIEFARSNGFIVAAPTIAKKGLEQKIIEKLIADGNDSVSNSRRHIAGGSLGVFGVSIGIETEKPATEAKSFQSKLTDICNVAARHNKGVLIMIDEVQNNEYAEEVAASYQELVGSGKNIAIIMAGLPSTVSALLNNQVLTFLARASKLYLEPIKWADIDAYYYKCFRSMKITLSEEQIMDAAMQTEGSPYLMQLIGHYITILADDNGAIDSTLFQKAITTAKKEYMNDLCQIALHGVSPKDIAFLQAMTEDINNSKITDIANRMDVTPSYAQMYKKRMIEAGLIEQESRGNVRFAVPMLREYLLKQK